jgi:hypothetical protein
MVMLRRRLHESGGLQHGVLGLLRQGSTPLRDRKPLRHRSLRDYALAIREECHQRLACVAAPRDAHCCQVG